MADALRSSLMSTIAPPRRWDGEFRAWWTPEQMRAFGSTWDEIHGWTMANAVRWDVGERERMGEATS